MNTVPLRPVTADEIATYEVDGVVCLRGLFDADWVARLRGVVDRSMSAHGSQTREYDTGGEGRFHANMFAWRDDVDLEAFVLQSPAAVIAGALMGASTVSFFFDHLLVKEPGTVNPTPWHQDLPYWPVLGDQICSLWFAMDSVTEASGGVRYVAGSHRWPTWFRAQSFDGSSKYSLESMPPAPDPDGSDEHRVVCFDIEPGDVVAHHVMTLHGARGNATTSARRRGLSTRWCGDDAVYDPRPATMVLPFEPGIAAGAPMRGDYFPVVIG